MALSIGIPSLMLKVGHEKKKRDDRDQFSGVH